MLVFELTFHQSFQRQQKTAHESGFLLFELKIIELGWSSGNLGSFGFADEPTSHPLHKVVNFVTNSGYFIQITTANKVYMQYPIKVSTKF